MIKKTVLMGALLGIGTLFGLYHDARGIPWSTTTPADPEDTPLSQHTTNAEKNHIKTRLMWEYPGIAAPLDVFLCRSEKELAVIKTAVIFGENEYSLNNEFIRAVLGRVNYWKKARGLERILKRAKRYGYISLITYELAKKGMPRELFYLSLQESLLNKKAVGPDTKWGIAKGMWQIIPDTAKRYHLRTGPLSHQRVYDPEDERHDVKKSTKAAINYIGDLHRSTNLPTSWLLIMASYNWGENRVLHLQNKLGYTFVNFADFYHEVSMPRQTRLYVLNIFAAAVIGNNPELFGFDMDNPLKDNQEQYLASLSAGNL